MSGRQGRSRGTDDRSTAPAARVANTQPTPHLETELKWIATAGTGLAELVAAARAAGFTCAPSTQRTHQDHYLDTEGFDLAQAGLGLRVRVCAGVSELGLKVRTRPRGRGVRAALWRRLELEIPLAAGSPLPNVAAALPASMRHRVEPYALARPLREIVVLVNERTRCPLRDASGAQIELAFDRVSLRAGSREETFTEVEVESADGDEAALRRLARAFDALGLAPSREDKLGRALTRIGVGPASPPSPHSSPELPLREAASRILCAQLAALRRAEPEARLGEDPEGVHRMRVATRRLRATLRLFRDVLPQRAFAAQRRMTRRTAERLGDVRDLDVLIGQFAELVSDLPPSLRDDARAIEALLRDERKRARARLLDWLASPVRLAAEERFERFAIACRAIRADEARDPIGERAPLLVAGEAERVFAREAAIARDAPIEDVHALRLALKRLRYAVESLEDVLPVPIVAAAKPMRELQDRFGHFNDACVAGERILASIDSAPGRRLSRRGVLAAGALLAVCDRRAVDARRALRRTWKEFARGKVRRAFGVDGKNVEPAGSGEPNGSSSLSRARVRVSASEP